MNLSTKWIEEQSLESLVRADALLEALNEVLEAELQAISRYDLQAMARIDDDKQRFVRQLEELVSQKPSEKPDSQSEGSQEELRALGSRISLAVGQVRAMVYANSALLSEAIAAITAKLGVDSRTCGYDSRARSVGPVRTSSTTSI